MSPSAIRSPSAQLAPRGLAAATVALLVAGALLLWQRGPADPLQRQAERFVELALALGVEHPDEIDAWFGPASLDARASGASAVPVADLLAAAEALHAEIAAESAATPSARSTRLERRVGTFILALKTLLDPKALSFADEALQLYDIALPPAEIDAAGQKALMDEIEALLPGQGTLAFRVAALQNKLVVPADKRSAVFERALAECRTRTLAHWSLPAEEQLTVEWTRDVEAAWHRYEGNYRSTVRVNSLALPFVGSALDVACHEGYPGHHAQFVLLEQAAAPTGLLVEDKLALLRTPESVLREGAANFGIDLVFPPAERLAFERDVLFPLAGLSPQLAEQHAAVQALIARLSVGVVPLLQQYRDGSVSFNSATFRLEREAMVSSPSALLQYVDEFGAYSVGYTVAKQRLQDLVASRPADEAWSVLQGVLLDPQARLLQTAPAVEGATTPP